METVMTFAFDLIAFGLQLAASATIVYGAVLALEIDVLVERLLKQPRALPAQVVAA
jgi:hypothetical protein